MDWFTALTGFLETGYAETRSRLRVDGDELVSLVNGRRYGIGTLELPTLAELRSRVQPFDRGRTTVRCVSGEARSMHADPAHTGALFQVASQFNLLEMSGPSVTPEDGVTRYVDDRTQGPACAVAAGAATIFRNYFAPVDGQTGQTRDRQLDGLHDVGVALQTLSGRPVGELWSMRNGYALCTEAGLAAVSALTVQERNALGAHLRIGLHRDVEVTGGRKSEPHKVSQAFCSALPVRYGDGPAEAWEPFARLVLDATYEATLLAAVEQSRDGSNVVLLTRVGGGVFGNRDAWIDDAIVRALTIVADAGLDVRLVSHGATHPSFLAIAKRFDIDEAPRP